MGSSASRPDRPRPRPSTSTSASDGERPAVRRRLDPLRRLSNLGRRSTKRDRPQSSITGGEDERDKRQRTSRSASLEEEETSDANRSDAEGEEAGGDPLALERTRTIDTIRQALEDDSWQPPGEARTGATPCSNTVPGPPVVALHVPTPPARQEGETPVFTPTHGLERRWSTSYTPATPMQGARDDYIPLTRTTSELPYLRFLNSDRGQVHVPGWYRTHVAERLRAMSNERYELSQRLLELRGRLDRQAEAMAAAGSGPQQQQATQEGTGGPGAAIMIQGLAQMQHNPRPTARGRFGRRRPSLGAAAAEQANTIASLLVVASAATATTLWAHTGPRQPPNQMLQSLMRRIRPRRPFSVRRNLSMYVYDSVPPTAAGTTETAGDFVTWLERVQLDVIRAMGDYIDGVPASLSRRNSDDPASPTETEGETASRPGMQRRNSAPVLASASASTSEETSEAQPEDSTPAGATNANGSGTTGPPLQFFRAHIFPPADPADTSPDAMVPCVFVGVRSLTHDPSQSADDLMRHPSFPFTDGQVPAPDPSAESDDESVHAGATMPEVLGGGQRRNTSLRSRLLALSPFTRHDPPDTPEPTEQHTPMSTFLVYVVGGRYPRNHPILSIPALLTGAPLTDEEMVLIGEMVGQVKPPTATAEEVEKSGLRVLDAKDIADLVEKDEILAGSAERCLVCLSDFEEGEQCRLLSCRHVFHKDCVDQWIKVGRNACPACRTEAVDKTRTTTAPTTTETETEMDNQNTAAEGEAGPSVTTV